jgi:hypothetical protein
VVAQCPESLSGWIHDSFIFLSTHQRTKLLGTTIPNDASNQTPVKRMVLKTGLIAKKIINSYERFSKTGHSVPVSSGILPGQLKNWAFQRIGLRTGLIAKNILIPKNSFKVLQTSICSMIRLKIRCSYTRVQ